MNTVCIYTSPFVLCTLTTCFQICKIRESWMSYCVCQHVQYIVYITCIIIIIHINIFVHIGLCIITYTDISNIHCRIETLHDEIAWKWILRKIWKGQTNECEPFIRWWRRHDVDRVQATRWAFIESTNPRWWFIWLSWTRPVCQFTVTLKRLAKRYPPDTLQGSKYLNATYIITSYYILSY